MLASKGTDTFSPYDHLSQVFVPEHSGRIRCRLGHTSMSYWSETSISLHTSGVVSREQLDEVLVQAAQDEKHASQLQSVMSTLMTQLSAHFRANFSSIQDMLASVSALAPPAPTTAPLTLATVPPGPVSAPLDDDEMLGEKNFNLPDF